MRLSGKVYDRVDGMLRQQARHERGVTDVALRENIARIMRAIREVGRVARVGELVEVDQFVQQRVASGQPLPHEVRTDETATASDE